MALAQAVPAPISAPRRRMWGAPVKTIAAVKAFRWATLALPILLALPASEAAAAIAFRDASATAGGNLTSISLSRPAGTQQNDIMLAVVTVRGGSGETITAPA